MPDPLSPNNGLGMKVTVLPFLRAMFFAMESLLHRFVYLKYALSIVLIFIGLKVFYAHFFGKLHPGISLGITLSVLAGGIILSLLRTRVNPPQKH